MFNADASEGAYVPTESESADIETTEVEETVTSEDQETTADPGASDDQNSANDAGEKETKKRNSFQERINQKTMQAKEAEQRARVAEERLRILEAQIGKTSETTQQIPSLKDFDYDEENYTQAMNRYQSDLSVSAALQAQRQMVQMEAAQHKQQAQTAVLEQFKERVSEFAQEHPDFDQVVSNPQLPMTKAITQSLVMAENGPAVAYHLAKNPELVRELANMPAPNVLMKIGNISAQLLSQPSQKKSKTPPPPTPPRGNDGKFQKDPESMTPEEYAKFRGYR